MPPSEQHTIVRFSLRSMLAITFGVALVMAIAAPFIKSLTADKKWQLTAILLSLCTSMLATGAVTIWHRYQMGQKCGPLLLQLSLQSQPTSRQRWFWLIGTLPGAVLFCYYFYSPSETLAKQTYANFALIVFAPAMLGIGIAKEGLKLWTEGYANAVEFCENGVTLNDKLYLWNTAELRQLYWNSAEDQLVININRNPITVLVPFEQREGVEAILEHYYLPPRTEATDRT